ncbi:MAG: binding-protein-dependent transport system inner rane component [Schumannella sp.]|nr:binding-protein-dependent transport system inner rane component [Schumannella sp.]
MLDNATTTESGPAALPGVNRRSRFGGRFTPLSVVAALIVFGLIIAPIGFLIYGSLRDAPPGLPGSWTLEKFAFLGTSEFLTLLYNSAFIALVSTVLAFVIGLIAALSIGRIGIPGGRWLDSMMVLPGYLPPFMVALAWTILLSPSVGYVNNLFATLGLPTFDIYSMGGIIMVMTFCSAPLAYLYLRPSVLGLDTSMEEASLVLGVSRFRTFRAIILRLMTPGLLSCFLVIFVTNIGEFSIPAVLGANARIYTISSQLYQMISNYPDDPNAAAVLGLFLISITGIGVIINRRIIRKNEYVTVGTRGARQDKKASPLLRWSAFAFCVVYFILAAALPIAAIVIGSLQPYLSPTLSAGWTLDHYVEILTNGRTSRVISNTIWLGLGASVLGVAISVIVARATMGRSRFAGALQAGATLPLSVPHIVFGLALVWMWLSLGDVGLYGTPWILLVGYIALFLPFGVQALSSAMTQLDRSLDEAAHVFGANAWRSMRYIVVPLLVPAALSAFTVILYHAVRELSASLLLYTPGNEVMSVQIWSMYIQGNYVGMFALGFLNIVLVLVLVAVANRVVKRWRRI